MNVDAAPLLDRRLLQGDAPDVAPRLLHKLLVSTIGAERVVVRLSEVEAYTGCDPASHSYPGPGDRNRVMFGPAGRLYVYRSYGLHWCANVVTGAEGDGQAVLLRAGDVVEGMDTVRRRRGERPDRELTNGPGKLCQALGIDLGQLGADLCDGRSTVRLHDDGVPPPPCPQVGPRVGISKAVDTPWRFRVGR